MTTSLEHDDKIILTSLYSAAVDSADPLKTIVEFLPERPKGRTIVVGAGKGVAQMARAVEIAWNGPLEGVVVTRYGYSEACDQIEVLEASHPVPDALGADAALRIMSLVEGLCEDDLVIALICGGGSALLPMPAAGLDLNDEIELNRALLESGAPISVMNAIRKQFSAIKGGRLAKAAAPAKVVTLVVSDVPGDDPAQVASGPTIADPTTRSDAINLIETWKIGLPARLREWLDKGDNHPLSPIDPIFQTTQCTSLHRRVNRLKRRHLKLGAEAFLL